MPTQGKKPAVKKPAARKPAPAPVPVTAPEPVVATAAPKPRRFPVDRRFLVAAGILLGLGALFLLTNAKYFAKRVSHQLNPPTVEERPPQGVDPYLQRLAGTPDRILIPSLGIEAPVVYATARTQAAYKAALKDGVAHLPGTADPGQPGNAYLFGHSSDIPWTPGDYKTVFALLPDIAIGDMIYVTDHAGNVFSYAARETRVVRPDDLSVTEIDPERKRTLTLQTSYPVGTALRRFIVMTDFTAALLVK